MSRVKYEVTDERGGSCRLMRLEKRKGPDLSGPFRVLEQLVIVGGRDGIRTHDPWLRRPVLYPTELPALKNHYLESEYIQQSLGMPSKPKIYSIHYFCDQLKLKVNSFGHRSVHRDGDLLFLRAAGHYVQVAAQHFSFRFRLCRNFYRPGLSWIQFSLLDQRLYLQR